MIVRVTKEHIERGVSCHGGLCPVALALRDVGVAHPWVTDDYWVDSEAGPYADERLQVPIPTEVGVFVDRFDRDRKDARLKPFTFRIRKPRAAKMRRAAK